MTHTGENVNHGVTAGILYADVRGFSALNRHQLLIYTRRFLPALVADVFDEVRQDLLEVNTWGDSFFILCTSPSLLANIALKLRDYFRHRDWGELGLPVLAIRIAVHIGEVWSYTDEVRQNAGSATALRGWVGSELNFGARLEPLTPPNCVWTTTIFRDVVCGYGSQAPDNMRFDPLGPCVLPKGAGVTDVWHLRRPDDRVCDRPIRPIEVVSLPVGNEDHTSIHDFQIKRLGRCKSGELVRAIMVTGRTALLPNLGVKIVPLSSWALPSALKSGVFAQLVLLDPTSHQADVRSAVESGASTPPEKRLLQTDAQYVVDHLIPTYEYELGMSPNEIKRHLEIRRTKIDLGFSLWLFDDVAVLDPTHLGKEVGRQHLCHFAHMIIPKERPEYALLSAHFDYIWDSEETKSIW